MSAKPIFHSYLPLAVRAYPATGTEQEPKRAGKFWRPPEALFVFDTETRIDATQRLMFGNYRFIVSGECLEEGLFHAPDISEQDRQTLEKYIESKRADVSGSGSNPVLRLLTLPEFVDRLFLAAYKARALVVGFNLPFDLSRVACGFANARGRFAGGFALELWSYLDQNGNERPDPYRPRIGIKHIDSKRALKGFTARKDADAVDLKPEDGENNDGTGHTFRGHFLDLRTLAFSLTDRGHSLESACGAFGVEHGKQHVEQHGIVTEAYIDYNRRDVQATAELAFKLLEEYAKHPIALQFTKAYSPASIGKAYLRGMGISPILERQSDFPREYLGYAQSAFFGGRTSAHIRKVPVPVVYTDFLSMYPTVNSLMGLWRFVTAEQVRIIEHCQDEIQALLAGITLNELFEQATWKDFAAFVKITPNGDILPSRAKYSDESNDYQVAVNYLYSENSENALWFSLPDIIASVILSGRVPNIIDAFRMEPVGISSQLKPIKLRSTVAVDPGKVDFFKVVIEERKRVKSRQGISEGEKARLDKSLKVLANGASYGIYAEMNPREDDKKVNVTCYGIDPTPFTCKVSHPDIPGEYCFPPLASLITGAARLMLALLEKCVTDFGGTYAMEDTDSMAIVATERGGLVRCTGGAYQTKDGGAAVKALSWREVSEIAERFRALNPYDRAAIPGSILKIEDDNFDPETKKQRQLYCYAISAKRYVLFLKDRKGTATLLRSGVNNGEDRWSEHGLGHLLNSTEPGSEDREWIARAWLDIIRRALKLPTKVVTFADTPAVGRVTVSSPAVMRAFLAYNVGNPYSAQIKPFNFLVTCHVKQMEHPVGADPERFHLIAPYETDVRRWLKMPWIDQYTGREYRIVTGHDNGNRKAARVKSYGEVLREYEYHPESKCADAEGKTCDKQTIGVLQRRHVYVLFVRYIGKESNHLEDVDAGLIHSEQSVYTEYTDARRDEWTTVILPALKNVPFEELRKESGMGRSALFDVLAGRSRPHPRNQNLLKEIVQKRGLI